MALYKNFQTEIDDNYVKFDIIQEYTNQPELDS